MPELPEVESVRQALLPLQGLRFHLLLSADPTIRRSLRSALSREILSIRRRGKYLQFVLVDRDFVVHLGMSGRLFRAPEPIDHPHLRWSFRASDGTHLIFVDRRRFGRFRVVPSGAIAFSGLATLGPEPLGRAFGGGHLQRASNQSRRSIKNVLLDQRVVAGLGNIYVDEALHAARIHPCQVGLDVCEAHSLVIAIKQLLRSAIELGGTSFSLHRDGLVGPGEFGANLRVFGRAGERCHCTDTIIKIVHAARGTHFCPSCQQVRPAR